MSAGPSMRLRAVLLFELAPVIKGPLLWAALASLVVLVVPIRYIMVGDIYNNGELVGKALRLNYVVAIGYSTIVFLTTLFALCFCLDRAGNHYLRNNDLLILSRNVGRPAFYLAKIASVFIPALAYGFTAIALFWEELYRVAGVNLSNVFILIFPLGLGTLCLVSLYFLMRNFAGNFMIFFLWLLLLARDIRGEPVDILCGIPEGRRRDHPLHKHPAPVRGPPRLVPGDRERFLHAP